MSSSAATLLSILSVLVAAHVQTVFVVLLENANWPDVRGSAHMPYLNGLLLPQAAHAEKYFNPPGLHPSEPNYIWLEAGQSFGVRDDKDPAAHHFKADHLTAQLERAGISWKAYQQGIAADECPTISHGYYAAKHDPFVYFDDVVDDPKHCVAHIRPLSELRGDLELQRTARYNFLTPDLCNDMHGAPGCPGDRMRTADDWLGLWIPRIMASQAYREGGAIFITWDEGEPGDGPIGLILLSPFARKGFAATERYTHSSLLRTLQEIFGVSPLLGDAAIARDLSALFTSFP